MNKLKSIPSSMEVLLKGYKKEFLAGDISGGITAGIISFPTVMAYAIASGVPPERGLYTAIVAGFVTALLSGSRYQIGGPTGAFTVLIYFIISAYGYDGLLLAMLMAGGMLIILSLINMGNLIRFIPYPLIVGFTSGIAVLMFTNQLKDFMGLPIHSLPANFFDKWAVYANAANLNNASISAILIGFSTIAIVIVTRKTLRSVPSLFAGVFVATLFCAVAGIDVVTLGSRFGELSPSMPVFGVPQLDFSKAGELLPQAFAIAMLAGIESLLCNVVSDGMTGYRHNSNVELFAQGMANVSSVFFGGIPSTGAVARTAISIKNGAKTPLAGMLHSVILFLMLLFLSPVASMIPLASLAAILLVIAWDISQVKLFAQLFKGPKSDTIILLVTFLLTVFVDLSTAVQAGVVIAALLFMKGMSDVTSIHAIRHTIEPVIDGNNGSDVVPKDVYVYRINGPFFFGIADKFQEVMMSMSIVPKVMILDMKNVPTMDATAANALSQFIKKLCRKNNIRLIVANVNEQPMDTLRQTELHALIGKENIVADFETGLKRAKELVC